jgi:hypothetical protein
LKGWDRDSTLYCSGIIARSQWRVDFLITLHSYKFTLRNVPVTLLYFTLLDERSSPSLDHAAATPSGSGELHVQNVAPHVNSRCDSLILEAAQGAVVDDVEVKGRLFNSGMLFRCECTAFALIRPLHERVFESFECTI